MAHKLSSWFVSKKGMKFMFGLVGATSIGIISAHTLPHTIFLYKYREMVQCYKYVCIYITSN